MLAAWAGGRREPRTDKPTYRRVLRRDEACQRRMAIIMRLFGLGCIETEALESFAEDDPSEDIRGLAAALREANRG